MNTVTHHGHRLKAERKRLGLTQAEAAKQIGVSREMFARYEAGSMPKDPVISRMGARGFDVEKIFTRFYGLSAPSDPYEVDAGNIVNSQSDVNYEFSWRDVMILVVDELADHGVHLSGAKLAEFVDVLMELQQLGMHVDKKVVATQLRLVS